MESLEEFRWSSPLKEEDKNGKTSKIWSGKGRD